MDDLWSHSHLLINFHGLSTSTLTYRPQHRVKQNRVYCLKMIKPITYHCTWLRGSNSLGGNQSSLGLECSKSCQEGKLPIKDKPSHNSVTDFGSWYVWPLHLYNNDTNSKYAPSLAAVTSLVSRAMTLQAASCWYRAWESSWRVVCSCCRRVKLWSITASCKTETMDFLFASVKDLFKSLKMDSAPQFKRTMEFKPDIENIWMT